MPKLTAKSVENARAHAERREIPDNGCRGLYLIVQPTGRKAWAVRYRFGGKTRKLTLDRATTLAAARQAATAALHEVELGRDPALLKFEARASAAETSAARARDTVEALSAQFIEQHAKRKTRPSSWRQAEHVFHDIVLPAWQGRTVHDVRRRDIIDLVEAVAVDRPVMANRALAHLSKFFNWLCQREVIPASPCAGIARPGEEKARERVLNDDEIRRLRLACDAIGGPASVFVKLLLLTGQRRGEIAGAKWSEMDSNLWTMSGERMKGKQAHVVPLSTQALEIIASLPRIGDYLFGTGPVSHFDRIKQQLDEHMKLKPWVMHDLRRTVASGLAKLGVQVPVIEKVLGHRSGTFRGIVGVYQRHDFMREKADALQRWANHVEGVVSGKAAEDKVVPLSGRR